MTCDEEGQCNCKENIRGQFCHICRHGYFNFPNCTPCECDDIGSLNPNCHFRGWCYCKEGYEGEKCRNCSAGYVKLESGECTGNVHTIQSHGQALFRSLFEK